MKLSDALVGLLLQTLTCAGQLWSLVGHICNEAHVRLVGSVTFVIHVVVEKVFSFSVFVIRMGDRKQSYSCLQDKCEVHVFNCNLQVRNLVGYLFPLGK